MNVLIGLEKGFTRKYFCEGFYVLRYENGTFFQEIFEVDLIRVI